MVHCQGLLLGLRPSPIVFFFSLQAKLTAFKKIIGHLLYLVGLMTWKYSGIRVFNLKLIIWIKSSYLFKQSALRPILSSSCKVCLWLAELCVCLCGCLSPPHAIFFEASHLWKYRYIVTLGGLSSFLKIQVYSDIMNIWISYHLSHWPSDHMIRSRPLIGRPPTTQPL